MKVRGWEWRREKTWNSRLNRSRNSCIKTSEISCCREFFVYFSTFPSRSDQRPIFWSNTYPLMLENATLGEKQPVAAHWPQKKTRGCCHHLSWTRDLPHFDLPPRAEPFWNLPPLQTDLSPDWLSFLPTLYVQKDHYWFEAKAMRNGWGYSHS